MRPLLLAVLILSVMSTSRAFAGPGLPSLRPHTPSDDPFFSDRAPSEFPVFRSENRDQVSDERLDWRDPFRPFGTPPPADGSGGGQSVPLDGGISLLLAAGIGLGLKKMRKGQDIEKTV
jgi:hypothetical protein